MINIKKSDKIIGKNLILIVKRSDYTEKLKQYLSKEEIDFLSKEAKDDKEIVSFTNFLNVKEVLLVKEEKRDFKTKENIRRCAVKIYKSVSSAKIEELSIVNLTGEGAYSLAFVEGFVLKDYKFEKYFTLEERKTKHKIKHLYVYDEILKPDELEKIVNVISGVYKSRNLVNEPSMFLTATELANQIKLLGEEAGFMVEVFEKSKIESLKMGGLLAVNRGSFEPPTFSVLEWKPDARKNEKPFVFVGKGVVFDTGGLNLKPGNYMNGMKADMAGAAAVIGAIYSIAKNKLPIWVIGLVPATDNRPGNNAYAPHDVITMHNGMTIEVLNTDAEGRMILADALSYASKYNPELVIDLATLTGAAARAIGHYGIVAMHNNDANEMFSKLASAGEKVYERIVEFPFWDEYKELLKSNVADIKNIGGVEAGAITAGKFLEYFTSYPYIHLDIAGPAYIEKDFYYMSEGGTGVGVRLLNEMMNNL